MFQQNQPQSESNNDQQPQTTTNDKAELPNSVQNSNEIVGSYNEHQEEESKYVHSYEPSCDPDFNHELVKELGFLENLFSEEDSPSV